jgi:hypothetical protein
LDLTNDAKKFKWTDFFFVGKMSKIVAKVDGGVVVGALTIARRVGVGDLEGVDVVYCC